MLLNTSRDTIKKSLTFDLNVQVIPLTKDEIIQILLYINYVIKYTKNLKSPLYLLLYWVNIMAKSGIFLS